MFVQVARKPARLLGKMRWREGDRTGQDRTEALAELYPGIKQAEEMEKHWRSF